MNEKAIEALRSFNRILVMDSGYIEFKGNDKSYDIFFDKTILSMTYINLQFKIITNNLFGP